MNERQVRDVVDKIVSNEALVADSIPIKPEGIPLHVRVALALGCELITPGDERLDWDCGCENYTHGVVGEDGAHHGRVVEYGEDSCYGWYVTGPLLKEYGIHLAIASAGNWVAHTAAEEVLWDGVMPAPWPGVAAGRARQFRERRVPGATPCEAIANLILALHEAGRLKK